MKKFVLVFHGNIRPEDITKEAMKETMDSWMAWFGTFKENMVDGGNPFANGAMSVTKKGIETIPTERWPARGYTIINAESMEQATEIAKTCPALQDGDQGAVDVYEAMAM